jgi:hypothetical protein
MKAVVRHSHTKIAVPALLDRGSIDCNYGTELLTNHCVNRKQLNYVKRMIGMAVNVRSGSTTEVEYLNSLAAAFEWESDVTLL